jgi:hypothetical protein
MDIYHQSRVLFHNTASNPCTFTVDLSIRSPSDIFASGIGFNANNEALGLLDWNADGQVDLVGPGTSRVTPGQQINYWPRVNTSSQPVVEYATGNWERCFYADLTGDFRPEVCCNCYQDQLVVSGICNKEVTPPSPTVGLLPLDPQRHGASAREPEH